MSPYVQCRYTSDCPSGQYCDDWQLCKRVSEGSPCDAHYSCKPPSSSLGSGSSDLICCWTTGKCTSHLGCAFSRRVYCSASSDCHANDYCDEKERKCVARIEPGGSCTDDDQVKRNHKCYQGKVVSPCKTDSDCAHDEECSVSYPQRNYYCFKKPSSFESNSPDLYTFSDYSAAVPAEESPSAAHTETSPADAAKESPSSNYSSGYSSDNHSNSSSNLSWILPVSISSGILLILIIALIVRRKRQAKKAALMSKFSNSKVTQTPPPMPDMQSSPYHGMTFHPYQPHPPYQAHSSPFADPASSVEPRPMPSQQDESHHDLPPYQPN